MVTQRTLAFAATLALGLAACGRPVRHAAMWATGADASSSGSATTQFSALAATGAPDVVGCNDDPLSWSPATANTSAPEYLVLEYPRYVHVTDIRIYETFNPGAIVQVDVEAADGHTPPLTLFGSNTGDGNPGCPTVFHISVDNGDTPNVYNRVAIYLQPNLIGDRNGINGGADDFAEIDAVELSGTY